MTVCPLQGSVGITVYLLGVFLQNVLAESGPLRVLLGYPS